MYYLQSGSCVVPFLGDAFVITVHALSLLCLHHFLPFVPFSSVLAISHRNPISQLLKWPRALLYTLKSGQMLTITRLVSRSTASSTETNISPPTTKRVRDSVGHSCSPLTHDLSCSPHSAPSPNSRCISYSRPRDISPKLSMLSWYTNRCDPHDLDLGR